MYKRLYMQRFRFKKRPVKTDLLYRTMRTSGAFG